MPDINSLSSLVASRLYQAHEPTRAFRQSLVSGDEISDDTSIRVATILWGGEVLLQHPPGLLSDVDGFMENLGILGLDFIDDQSYQDLFNAMKQSCGEVKGALESLADKINEEDIGFDLVDHKELFDILEGISEVSIGVHLLVCDIASGNILELQKRLQGIANEAKYSNLKPEIELLREKLVLINGDLGTLQSIIQNYITSQVVAKIKMNES